MNVTFVDMGDESNPLNGSTIRDSGQLLQILRDMQGREPSFCELLGENGYRLTVGIAPTFGCAQYSHSEGDSPYLVTVDEHATPDDGCKGFLYQNTLTEVLTRRCLPIRTILDVAAFFQETGNRSPVVSWEEV